MKLSFRKSQIGIGISLTMLFGVASVVTAQPGINLSAKASISGKGISGKATFSQMGDKVTITVQISGATLGNHGIHIHAGSTCEGSDFKSAGDHFSPSSINHGGPQSPQHHAGDLGNISIGANGIGTLSITISTSQFQLNTGANSIIGKTLIIHEKPDDVTTQPSGNSGARIACGLIQAGN